MKRMPFAVLALAVCVLTFCAQASIFTWTAGGGGATTTWITPANWGGAAPGSGDTAVFSGGASRTVTIDASNPTINTVNVSGPAQWTFATGGTLSVATAFNYSDAAASTFNAILAGPTMALNVSGGNLLLTNNANSFGGGINITGGKLTAALENVGGYMQTLGTGGQTITIGDSTGSADASLEVYGGWNTQVYAQPIVIASGSTGRAYLIGSKYDNGDQVEGIDFTGGVTLHKDLTLVNNTQRGGGYCDRRVMQISGDITGTGNIVKDGVGLVEFTSSLKTITVDNGGSGYTSAPTVNFSGGGGYNYSASATVVGGVVTAVTITSTGWALTATPTISFSGGGGSNAAATAVITSANDSYTGTTTVKDGWLEITGGTQTFTGDIHVDGGMLLLQGGDARLGNAANNLTLGSAGRYGVLTEMNGAGDLTTSRSITLNGNGGILGSYQQSFYFNGPIGGAGELVVDHNGYETFLNAANTYSGGTKVIWGRVFARNNVTALGAGNVVVDYSSLLAISGPGSVNASASVLVKSFSSDNSVPFGTVATLAIPANIGAVPTIDPSSSGKLALTDGNTSAAVNTLLASQIGNGYMFIGSSRNSNDNDNNVTLTGASLAIGAGNTYRFAPNSWGMTLDAAGTDTGFLADPDASTHANVLIGSLADFTGNTCGGWVTSNDAQTFSGTLYVNRSYYQAVALSSGSALGDAAGVVKEVAGVVKLFGSGPGISKGVWNVEAHSIVEFNENGGAGNSLTVASIARVNNGCLMIWPDNGIANLGVKNKFIVTTPPAEANGMVSPSILAGSNSSYGTPDFVDYDTVNTPSSGFIPAVYKVNGTAGNVASQGDFNSTVPANIVNVAGADVTLSGAKTLYALKTDSQILGSQTLTLTSGGLILTGAAKTHATNLSTTGEMAIAVGGTSTGNATRNILNGTITAACLTKTGRGTLVLGADNTATLTGDVTVDQGSLEITNDNQLGAASNRVILNNADGYWTDGFRLIGGVTLPSTRTIVLGNNGGNLFSQYGNATINGKITGSGPLELWSASAFILTNPANDYAGGTFTANTLYLQGGGQAGTGPVYAAGAVIINDNTYRPNRFVLTNDSRQPRIDFYTAAPSVGSLEGGQQYGGQSGQECVFLDATNAVLTLGGNNASTDLYGAILQFDDGFGNVGNAGITKVGAGTFSMYGMNDYTGATTVNNGTLNNNNIIRGAVNVASVSGSTPIYGGTGTTKGLVTVNAGGTAVGTGFFNAGLNVYGGAATGDITINGPLNVDGAGSFSSSGPITGAVVTAGAFAGNANITGSVSVIGGTFGGNHVINGTFTSSGAAVSGASTFNGPVTVSGGTFGGTNAVNANYTQNSGALSGASTFGSAGSPVAVAINAGSFSGPHTIHGSFTTGVGSNAVVATHNGDTAGTLRVIGDVALDHTTTLNFNLGAPGTVGGGVNDLIDVTGNVSLDGTLNVTGLTYFGQGTYTLLTYTGTLTNNLTLGTMPTGGYTYTFTSGTFHAGTVYELNLSVVSPFQPGDTNHDGVLNSLDIDAIYHNFNAAANSQWKVTTDGLVVGQEDVTYELRKYFLTNYGDANLDNATDFPDFQTLLDHWQASGSTIGWLQGDFNGDYSVDFLDFQKLLDYWNPGGWHYAPMATPEPASVTLLLLGGLALLRRKK